MNLGATNYKNRTLTDYSAFNSAEIKFSNNNDAIFIQNLRFCILVLKISIFYYNFQLLFNLNIE